MKFIKYTIAVDLLLACICAILASVTGQVVWLAASVVFLAFVYAWSFIFCLKAGEK